MATHRPITSALWGALGIVEAFSAVSLAPGSVRLSASRVYGGEKENRTPNTLLCMYTHAQVHKPVHTYVSIEQMYHVSTHTHREMG